MSILNLQTYYVLLFCITHVFVFCIYVMYADRRSYMDMDDTLRFIFDMLNFVMNPLYHGTYAHSQA